MAKKVKVSSSSAGNVVKKGTVEKKEETYEFTPAAFDEQEYIKGDILGTKVTLIVCAVSLIVGVCAGCLMNATGQWLYGLLLVGLAIAGMGQLIKLLGFDTSKIKASSMLGNYITGIFLMLCVWTLMINPPFV